MTPISYFPRLARKTSLTVVPKESAVAVGAPGRGLPLRTAGDPEQECGEAGTGPTGWLSFGGRGGARGLRGFDLGALWGAVVDGVVCESSLFGCKCLGVCVESVGVLLDGGRWRAA
jgi:hypothetical protein